MRLVVAFVLAALSASCLRLDDSGTGSDETFIEARDGSVRDTAFDSVADDAPVATETGPTIAEVCDFGVTAICAKYSACAPFTLRLVWGDESTCRARLRTGCVTTLNTAGISYGATEYLACMRKEEGASCESFFLGTICGFPAGSFDNGKPCSYHAQCASGFCDLASSFCGTCAPEPAEGATCTISCAPGSVCVGTTKKCTRYRSAGAACSADLPCAPPLVCAAGVCAAGSKLGAPCDPTGATGNPCSPYEGFYCGASRTCIAYAPVNAGDVCGYPEPYRYCSVGSVCDASTNGKCIAPAADGAPCDPSKLINCVSPSVCIDGFCKQRDPSVCK